MIQLPLPPFLFTFPSCPSSPPPTFLSFYNLPPPSFIPPPFHILSLYFLSSLATQTSFSHFLIPTFSFSQSFLFSSSPSQLLNLPSQSSYLLAHLPLFFISFPTVEFTFSISLPPHLPSLPPFLPNPIPPSQHIEPNGTANPQRLRF